MRALGVPEVFLGVGMQDVARGGDEVGFVEEGGGSVVTFVGGGVRFDDGAGDDADVVLAREGLVTG